MDWPPEHESRTSNSPLPPAKMFPRTRTPALDRSGRANGKIAVSLYARISRMGPASTFGHRPSFPPLAGQTQEPDKCAPDLWISRQIARYPFWVPPYPMHHANLLLPQAEEAKIT